MRVVIAGAGSPAGDATASALRERGHEVIEIGPHECDLRDFAAVQELAARLGAVDGVIHLVGGWRGGGGLAGQSDEDWDWLQAMIVGTLRNTTRAFAGAIAASPSGRFAIVSQTGVANPTAGNANYLAAKAAAETWLLAVGHALKASPASVHIERVMALYSDRDVEQAPDKDFSRHTHVSELGQRLASLFD
ncbi:MAG: SDR family NAD(P)-dependent oxidoreductase [Micropruina sp.]